ncbi:MAG: hypothetical protein KJ886_01710 [Candidatus Thermoplasmatota archaeon]|nr:hypothetical protein [Candidatus Thermoplasmatota archaeon]
MDWIEFDKLCYKLAEKVTDDNAKPDNILCIARGGLVIGRIMSDILGLPLHVMYTQRYRKGTKETYKSIMLTGITGTSLFEGNVLITDDITDEGITMKAVYEKIKGMDDVKNVKTAVLVHKPRSIFKPDYYAKVMDKWIIFPYEVCEYNKLKALEKR